MKKIFLIICSILVLYATVALAEPITVSEILTQVNQYRANLNLSPLTLDPIVSAKAAAHSTRMSSHQIPFSHDGFSDRAHELMKQFKTLRNVAENVAYIEADGHKIVKLWLNSDSHRKNIEGNFNLTGIGVAQDSSGKIYATQIFIRTG